MIVALILIAESCLVLWVIESLRFCRRNCLQSSSSTDVFQKQMKNRFFKLMSMMFQRCVLLFSDISELRLCYAGTRIANSKF